MLISFNLKSFRECVNLNQSKIIKDEIIKCIDDGMRNKQDIFSRVVEKLGVPRPTVRRCSKDLKAEMIAKVRILNGDLDEILRN